MVCTLTEKLNNDGGIYTVAKLVEELNRCDDNAQVIMAIWDYQEDVRKEEYDRFVEGVERVVDEEGQTYVRLWCFNNLSGN